MRDTFDHRDASGDRRSRARTTHDAGFEQTLDKTLELLKSRDHSRQELRRKLLQRGFPLEQIEAALTHCERQQWVADDRFARAYAQELLEKQEVGPRMIYERLRARGVSEDMVREVLEAHAHQVDWTWRARTLLARRITLPLSGEDLARHTRFLLSRGFALHDIRAALETWRHLPPNRDVGDL